MARMIRTRRGGVIYAIVAPLLALLLSLPLFISGVSAFSYATPFMDLRESRPVFLVLTVWMGFSLCAFALLARWIFSKQLACHGTSLGNVLLSLLIAVLMWFPAAIGAPVFYALNLIWLLRGKYPDSSWNRLDWLRLAPCLGIVVLLVLITARPDVPADTPERALLPRAENPGVLARLPQEDGSLLLITFGECGIVEETAEGWVLREAYKAQNKVISDGESSAHAYLCRSQTEETDVVVVWKVDFFGEESAKASIPPRDSANSAFSRVVESDPFTTSYYYYALVDVDAPGYELYIQ